ncbi:transporter [Halomonas elongata]|uniref:transporter n=1 Tax=Halomonas elongata TaxID=2746 RepID=UPI0023AF2A9D|nr:transporter [Halomonas elongata]
MVLAAPQTFNTALPIAEDSFVLREQLLYRHATSAQRDLDVTGAITVLGYGLTSDIALFGAIPYLDKTLDGGRRERSGQGFGDVRLFARYTAFKDNAPGRTFRIAPFFGVETPTGDDDERDRFGRLPQPLQSGSGSWDPFGGVILTYQTLAYQLDAQVAYQANTEANGFEFGDKVRLDGAFQYRLWPRELGGGLPAFLYGALEANLIHHGKNEVNGIKDDHSGGTQLFLSPGLQYVTSRWVIEGTVQLPVAQDLNGTALEDDVVTRIGFRINF